LEEEGKILRQWVRRNGKRGGCIVFAVRAKKTQKKQKKTKKKKKKKTKKTHQKKKKKKKKKKKRKKRLSTRNCVREGKRDDETSFK